MTSFFEEQQSLLAAYSLQAQESAPRSEDLEHARWLQQREDEYDRQIEEQAEFARKAQEQWAEEDRLFLEKMRKEAEEKYRRDVEAMEQAIKEEQRQAERKRKEEEARRAEAERIRRERMAECIACGDEFEKTAMLITTCNHAYGGDCLQAAFRLALKSKEPFACCGRRVDIGLAARHFDSKFVASYRLLQLERDTPNPLYCSVAICSAFIVPSAIRGDEGTCGTCKVKTCRHCRKAAHSGVCSADKDGQETRALANKMGWKECPRCNQIVDRRSGCLHMTCKCGGEFCYSCGKLYSECPGSCRRTT
ncbi:hypothetical protein K440DRAFT_559065 [Wilcoxina mikolae CBS 423.85]|nr:hypothetical protein K440DRAFT_559065 [Wilcoxina mikolae CBS 423.85]